ncbi:MAG: hypothetical protein IT300_18820 [Dehalococcoidia bacterium]|nr:hypothetical protein [Dehalococcoidia bacterium]
MNPDQIEAPWAKMPLHVICDRELTANDLRVYAVLDFLSGKRGWFYDSREEIACKAQVSAAAVSRAIDVLRRKSLIRTEPMGLAHGNVNKYFVLARTIPLDADNAAVVNPDKGSSSPDDGALSALITASLKTTDLPQTTPKIGVPHSISPEQTLKPSGPTARGTKPTIWITEAQLDARRQANPDKDLNVELDRYRSHDFSSKWKVEVVGFDKWLAIPKPAGNRPARMQAALPPNPGRQPDLVG